MAGTYVTDVRHYLGPDGNLAPRMPGPAHAFARFLGAIIAWVTACGEGETNVSCRRRPRQHRCAGDIVARKNAATRAIEWACPACGDNGVISGWEGTKWDRHDPGYVGRSGNASS